MPKLFIFPMFSYYFTVSFFLHPLFVFTGGFLLFFRPPFIACMDPFCGFVYFYQLPKPISWRGGTGGSSEFGTRGPGLASGL